MSTFTVIGRLRYCHCGHGEHEHRDWWDECSLCTCRVYRRDRSRHRPATDQQGATPA